MANLENFVSLYEDFNKARTFIQESARDANNPEIYDTVVSKTIELTGQDPTFDPATNQRIELSQNIVRRLLDSWHSASQTKAKTYAENNLESLVDEFPGEKLMSLALNTPPKTKSEEYRSIVELHQEYMVMAKVLRMLESTEKESEKNQALSMIRVRVIGTKDEKGLIEKRIEEYQESLENEKRLDEKSIKTLANTLKYIALIHANYAMKVFREDLKEKQERLKEMLKEEKKARDYIISNYQDSEDKEKEGFYEAMFQIQRN